MLCACLLLDASFFSNRRFLDASFGIFRKFGFADYTGSLNNYSKEGCRRVDWKIGIAYGDDFDTARKAILELLAADKRVFDDPAPFVVLSSLADSAIEITVRVWTASENYWGVFFDFNEQVYKQFDKYGLHFPYPQVDVHMIQDNH